VIASVEKGHEHRNAVLKGAASCVGREYNHSRAQFYNFTMTTCFEYTLNMTFS